MFHIVLQKMLNNKWMFLCLLVGCILVVALVSSIPLYSHGILQKMLTKDLEQFQKDTRNYPGKYHVEMRNNNNISSSESKKVYDYYSRLVNEDMTRDVSLPVLEKVERVSVDHMFAVRESEMELEKPQKIFFMLDSLTDLENHITLTAGRMPSPEKQEEIYETVVTERTFKDLGLLLDTVYVVNYIIEDVMAPIKIKIVGVFTIVESSDIYWFNSLHEYNESLFINHELFKQDFLLNDTPLLSSAEWYYAFDYHSITLENVGSILNTLNSQQRWFKSRMNIELNVPATHIFEQYLEREKHLKITLWVLMVPILLMLFFYIFMVSLLILKNEENEIAVLKSRGASSFQSFRIYLIESLIISAIAIIAGPCLGFFLCKILGASNGFMKFVQRSALPIKIDNTTLVYALCSLVFFIISMLLPAYVYSKTSIVLHKQKKSRSTGTPFWKKFFLDIIVLGISAYGLYGYRTKQEFLGVSGLKGTELEIDPLLFLISTFFILGVGMLFLRVYPYLIRLISRLGRELWSPVFYITLSRVGRAQGREQFIMLFIIFALSIGILNANEARTINKNIEEKVIYEIGADVTLMAHWEDNQPDILVSAIPSDPEEELSASSHDPIRYEEPPFIMYENLSGVESATKVFVEDRARVRVLDSQVNNVKFMGIIPDKFGKTAWLRSDLLKPHWHNYLNIMASAPKAMLLSRNFETVYDVKLGDSISIHWGEDSQIEGTVYAFIDYWPAFNPALQSANASLPSLVVANLTYIQNLLPLEPYQVWIKKHPETNDTDINNDIIAKELELEQLNFTDQEIIRKKNDPLLQGTNGALTLGFIITMLITTIGFLIYWILSIKERVLQFGILRAIGLSLRKVMGIIILEQIILSCVAIVVGIVVGGMASDIFVPLLQLVYSTAEQVPPFKVIASREDYIKIYAVVSLMLVLGFFTLRKLISSIKIDQALKLGED